MAIADFLLRPIGIIRSSLTDRHAAPKQGHEGAPDAWVEIDPQYAGGLLGLEEGAEVILITWLHESDREVLRVRPRRDPNRAITGVFNTRSPDRPNPLGLHRVTIREINGSQLKVGPLEAIDGTPVVDIKRVLTNCHDS